MSRLECRHTRTRWRDTLFSHVKDFATGVRTMGGEHSGDSSLESMGLALCGHDLV